MSFLTVPGSMWPGQRTTSGARMPPSQVLSLPPLNGVVPPSGKVIVSAPLSVVKTTMVLSSSPISSSFFSTYADVVVHLLHAGFVDAPVLAAGLADHGQVLVRQHRRDVHARRVVPDEERLVGLLRVVAVEEVDDLGGDFLVNGLRALQRQRTLVLAGLVLGGIRRRICTRASDAAASGRSWSWDPRRRVLPPGRGSACSCKVARSPARSGSC